MRAARLNAEWVIPTESEAAVLDTIDGLRRELGRLPTMQEIADSVGMTRGGVAYHFRRALPEGISAAA